MMQSSSLDSNKRHYLCSLDKFGQAGCDFLRYLVPSADSQECCLKEAWPMSQDMDCLDRLGSYMGYSSLLLLQQLRRLGGGGSVFLSFNQGLTTGSQHCRASENNVVSS